MSKMSELDITIKGVSACGKSLVEAAGSMRSFIETLKRCGDSLIEAESELEGYFGTPVEEAPVPVPQVEEPVQKVTIEEVRALLLEKRRAGFKDEIKALLAKHNASKLTEVNPDDYADLLAEAEVLGT